MSTTLTGTLVFDPAVAFNGVSGIGTASKTNTFAAAQDMNDFLSWAQQQFNVWATDTNGKTYGQQGYIPTLPHTVAQVDQIILAWWNSVVTGTAAQVTSWRAANAVATAQSGVTQATFS